MFGIVLNGLVIAGACILIASLVPVRQLITRPLPGPLRRKWHILATLILFFIVGYAGYAVASWERNFLNPDFIVPVVFFFGACFVWLTSNLSLKTVNDVQRVAFLEQENVTDPLINIYNRRYLERRLEEEFARARRQALPLSVLLIDIDHFKHINDTYGHPCGDVVLKHCGKLLQSALRLSDVLTRYGGEEFVVIMPHGLVLKAVELGERLRQCVESHELLVNCKHSQRHKIRVTISIGVACLDEKTENAQQLIRYADRALYRAKHEGRNRVVVYSADVF